MNTLPSRATPAPGRHAFTSRALRGLIGTALIALASGALAQAPKAAPAAEAVAEKTEPVLNSSLTAPLFYQLLLGEINVRQGDPGAGFSLIQIGRASCRERV